MDLRTILSNQHQELLDTDYNQYISRPEEKQIDLNSPLAQIVIGVRRCGKSTLCQKVLMESNINFGYINFDDENLADLKAEQLNDLIEILYEMHGQFNHLFLDEIQNVPSWPLFVNRLLRQKMHIVLTGSNANLLSHELSTHLTGRYNQITLYPFSFQEFCLMNNIDTKGQATKHIGLRQHALNNYLQQGGMPELLNIKNQRTYTQSLLTAIIEKDVCRRYKVRYPSALRNIADNLLDQFCQEQSFSDVAKRHSLKSFHTAQKYMDYLSEAFLLCNVPKFSFKSADRQKTRKCYTIDLAFVDYHPETVQAENLGWRLENIVAIELMRRMQYETQELFYLRKNKEYECDFVLVSRSKPVELIQVTYDFTNPSTKLYNREINGLIRAAKETHCQQLTLVMMYGEKHDIQIDDMTIHCIPATEWLLSNN